METEMKEKIISYMRDEVRRPITAEELRSTLVIEDRACPGFHEAHIVAVHETQRAHACCCQVKSNWTAKSACPDKQHTRLQEPFLSLFSDTFQDEVTIIS